MDEKEKLELAIKLAENYHKDIKWDKMSAKEKDRWLDQVNFLEKFAETIPE